LVTLDPVLKNTFASYLQDGRSRKEAALLFMDWLSQIESCPTSSKLREFQDQTLLDLLGSWILVPSPAKRKTLAEVLSHQFVVDRARLSKASTGPLTQSIELNEPGLFSTESFQEMDGDDGLLNTRTAT